MLLLFSKGELNKFKICESDLQIFDIYYILFCLFNGLSKNFSPKLVIFISKVSVKLCVQL